MTLHALGLVMLTLALAAPAHGAFPSKVDPFFAGKFVLPDPVRSCAAELRTSDLKKTRYIVYAMWMRHGGPAGPMGCPRGARQRDDGRAEVSFDNGSIVDSPDWGQNGVLAAYQDHLDRIVVDWTVDWFDLPGPNYDKFLLRWGQVGRGQEQEDIYSDMSKGQYVALKFHADTHLRTKGTRFLSPPEPRVGTTYTIVVKGCNVAPWPAKDSCAPGWAGPAYVVYTPRRPTLNQFASVDLRPERRQVPSLQDGRMVESLVRVAGFEDVQGSRATFLARASRAILAGACGSFLPWNVYRNESDATFTAVAKMAFAEVFQSDRCPGRDVENRKEVAEWLLRQRVESKVGTTSEDPPALRTGEYDVALKGWIALLYAFGHALPNQVYLHVLEQLLNKRGGYDPADHWWGAVGVPIPETENHSLMIETSRYLTNQLLCDRRLAPPEVCDNGRNGLNGVLLQYLHRVLTQDFVEYNSRPYQDYTVAALLNLASYARDPRVKTAATMVLDYVFVKVAASSESLRRSAPFRRRRSHDQAAFFETFTYEPMAGYLAQLAGNTRLLGDFAPLNFQAEMVWAAVSEYRIPPLVLDVIVNRESRTFYQAFRHATTEIYFGSPSYTVSAGGTPSDAAYKVMIFSSGEDHGVAVPTLFLPTNRAYRSRDEAVRFPITPPDYGNLCVAPHFACGSELIVPPYLGSPARQEGPWAFFNDGSPASRLRPDAMTDALRVRERVQPAFPGYYLAVFRGQGITFLEAYDRAHKATPLSLEQFVEGVLGRNGRSRFDASAVNRYVTTDGTVIDFAFPESSIGANQVKLRLPTVVAINGRPPVPPPPGIAAGSFADSQRQAGFFRIRSPNPTSAFADCELILDGRDPLNPVRTVNGSPICETGEKVGTFSEYKPCTPVVFVPAPDAPAARLSQAWGDRGIWDQDRINVRLVEAPKGSGQFDVRIREVNPRGTIEVSAEKVRVTEAPTLQYGGPLYEVSVASPGGPGTTQVPKVGSAQPPNAGAPIWTRPGPAEPSGAVGGGSAARPGTIASAGIAGPAANAAVMKLPVRYERSLGLGLDRGVRLEVDILCDERLSPRVYGLRYLRRDASGKAVVDVMLKFSQPPPR